MQISSAAGAYVQQASSSANKVENRVEGSRPDGDNDKDDTTRVTNSSSPSQTTAATGSVGINIDVTA